jgi:hypothetical protein
LISRITHQVILLTVTLSVVCSCATDSGSKVDDVKVQFSTVAIVTPDNVVAIEGAETKFTRAVKGVTYGSAGGAVGGAMVGALACGPYFYGVCVVGMSAAGMLAGGTAGAMYGFTGVSKQDSLYILEEIENLRYHRDFQSELAEGVIRRLPMDIVSTPEEAAAQAIAHVKSIEFIETDKGSVYMEINARVTIVSRRESASYEQIEKSIIVSSSVDQLENWLTPGSDKFESAVNECMEKITEEMATIVLYYASGS